MLDKELLNQVIQDSGMTVKAICEKSGINRFTFYNRLKGIGDFTATEIVGLSRTLQLTKTLERQIFFSKRFNEVELKGVNVESKNLCI